MASGRGSLKRGEVVGLCALFVVLSLAIWAGYASLSVPGALIPLAAGIAIAVGVVQSTQRRLRHEIMQAYRNLEALGGTLPYLELARPVPPLGGHALSANRARILVDAILGERPEHVVEFGSGISTVLAAQCLKRLGSGRIDSFEHERVYAERSRALLDAYGLSDIATVHYAPLENVTVDGTSYTWYSVGALPTTGDIDLLVVDGPPRKVQEHARYPAFPILRDRLRDGALVLLDDADRKDERWITSQWQAAGELSPVPVQYDPNMRVMRFQKRGS